MQNQIKSENLGENSSSVPRNLRPNLNVDNFQRSMKYKIFNEDGDQIGVTPIPLFYNENDELVGKGHE